MRRWLPFPLLSAALCAMWLLLNDSVSPGNIVLGVLAGVLLPLWIAPLKPAGPPLRHVPVLVRLILRVGRDVVLSALTVGAAVLRSGGTRLPRSRFVPIPLDLRDPHGLAALAMITAVIPGTVWAELAPDSSVLLLHVFDLEESEAEFVELFKARYELPLKEIFG